jgi:hypothetical protein
LVTRVDWSGRDDRLAARPGTGCLPLPLARPHTSVPILLELSDAPEKGASKIKSGFKTIPRRYGAGEGDIHHF